MNISSIPISTSLEKTQRLIQQRLQTIDQILKADDSTNLKARKSSSSYQPWSQEDYLDRLWTFRPPLWTRRSKAIEGPFMARHGWRIEGCCSRKDVVCCLTCNRSIHLPWLEEGLCEQVELQLIEEYTVKASSSGHATNCPWSLRPCAEAIMSAEAPCPRQIIEKVKGLLTEHSEQCQSICITNDIMDPIPDALLLCKFPSDLSFLTVKTAVAIVASGWNINCTTRHSCIILECMWKCGSVVHNNSNSGMLIDLRAQHALECPAIIGNYFGQVMTLLSSPASTLPAKPLIVSSFTARQLAKFIA